MVIDLGSVVLSKAGRDSGRYFVVVEVVNKEYVRICDGDTHPQSKAKLKKLKHLKANGDVLIKIADKFREHKQVFDAEICSALRIYNQK
jgi:ribosomal protein L14E/L6E/L27E